MNEILESMDRLHKALELDLQLLQAEIKKGLIDGIPVKEVSQDE